MSQTPTANTEEALRQLAALLRRRIEIIADHSWRERDPESQLEALKSVSEEIGAAHEGLAAAGGLPPRLGHFLVQCSFDKALAFIEGE